MFDKLVDLYNAETSSITELAEIAAPGDIYFFRGVDFNGTDLRGENLSKFDLTDASFSGAIYDSNTKVSSIFYHNLNNNGIRHEVSRNNSSINYTSSISEILSNAQRLIFMGQQAQEMNVNNNIIESIKLISDDMKDIENIIKNSTIINDDIDRDDPKEHYKSMLSSIKNHITGAASESGMIDEEVQYDEGTRNLDNFLKEYLGTIKYIREIFFDAYNSLI